MRFFRTSSHATSWDRLTWGLTFWMWGGILLGLWVGCQQAQQPLPPSKTPSQTPSQETPQPPPPPEAKEKPLASQPTAPKEPTSSEPPPASPPSTEPTQPPGEQEKPHSKPTPSSSPETSLSPPKEGKTLPEKEESAFDPQEIERRRKMIEEEMARQEAQWREKQKKRIAELGMPLVENADKLIRLHPVFPVWADRENKRIVMVGEICKREGPLEMFACLRRTKEHESIVVVDTTAQIVHAGLLALGAQNGRPVQYDPVYRPATGDEIEVTVLWKDKDGKANSCPAQHWIRHMDSKKPMEHSWVFAGSMFAKSEETGQVSYMAEGGDFICVSNFPTAMLDLPVLSSNLNAELQFEAFTERIPPEGTPVTVILTPKKKPIEEKSAEKTPETSPKSPQPTPTPPQTDSPKSPSPPLSTPKNPPAEVQKTP